MNGWKGDKNFSDTYLKEIKRILGEHLIGEPNEIEDQKRNTDLIVLKMEAVRIGCRIRRSKYLDESRFNASEEFTIRSCRDSGMKTELAKIIEGWGDYFFYGFGNDDGTLVEWLLADLKIFRICYARALMQLDKMKLPGSLRKNSDGSSSFHVFRWDDFPSELIVAKSEPRKISHEVFWKPERITA